jgi:hypothetical protein
VTLHDLIRGVSPVPRHAKPTPSLRRATLVALALSFLLTVLGGATAALAQPSPPTNGGNGAGQSGQCTGPASERPTSCQSPGGVSGR